MRGLRSIAAGAVVALLAATLVAAPGGAADLSVTVTPVSWVVPTSMVLITLERARRKGLIRGSEFKKRLRLGAEMLLDRAVAVRF